ncbi:uncharacterized protein DDB_G0287625 isoform X1 [Eurosta solidaginis]|uniref:uncharacterized protein DDB_G0287625 isoform X1 n=1 Tax=Eurosta solidaginis TaxID=178769 RepID=UPI003530BEFD
MSASISKIHVTNSTGLSLNERFTAVQDRRRDIPEITRPRPRPPPRDTSVSNRRLLQQLARRHKLQAALKLKRRSMRPIGGNLAMRRGTIKAFRVAANGKPIRTNSMTTVATMEADLISNSQRNLNRPMRRSNSVSNRLGSRRSLVGGAAQRIAQRRLQRTMSERDMFNVVPRRGRSRSRSRAPVAIINLTRSRSRSGGRLGNARQQMRGRSRSRNRQRSRSRMNNAGGRANIPVKARLGVRPGTIQRRRRSASALRGVAQGRIQRRRLSNMTGGIGGRAGRQRGRSMTRNTNNANAGRSRSNNRNGAQVRTQSRARSRTRRTSMGGQRNKGSVSGGRIRGRSQQRRGGRSAGSQRNGKANGNNNNGQQQQQRRGRSRSRGGRGGRNQGKNAKPEVDKEKLDKELDQYMATTRTDNF